MKRALRPVTLVLAMALLLTQPAGASVEPLAAAASAAPGFTIHLRSRQFTPAPGLETALERRMAAVSGSKLHALVQLHGPPTLRERADFKAQGVDLLRYVPHQAWLASIPNDVSVLRRLLAQRVRFFGELAPNDRISPDVLRGQFGPWAARADGTVELVVTWFDDVDPSAARSALAARGGVVLDSYPAGVKFVVRIGRPDVQGLAREDGVQWIAQVPPPKQTLNDGARANSGVETYHGGGVTGSGVVAAMWDAGYVGSHPDFGARVSMGDATGSVHSHATHVAGTMAGAGAVNPLNEGMAPDSNVVSYYWDNHLSDYPDAVNIRGARLSQNSWGFYSNAPSFCYWGAYIWDAPELDQIVRGYLGLQSLEEGIPVMFAVGNDQKKTGACHSGSGYDTATPPATAKNVISVGAINTDDSSMTSFSSWGPTDDGRLKPEVVAGGCQTGGDGGVTSTLPGGGYGVMCGTSMATPGVSGLVALLRQHYLAANPGAVFLPSTAKAVLTHTANELGNPGPDYRHGYGSVSASAAKALIASGNIIQGQLTVGGSFTKNITVPEGSSEFKVTLAWADKEAVENAGLTLVNDFDLVVVDPNGVRHFPWRLDPSNPGSPATRAEDHTNPLEQVRVSPLAGVWSVAVTGAVNDAAPFPAQSFTLVWSVEAGTALNTAPLAQSGSAATNEDVAVAVPLSGADSEQCELTFSIVASPNKGSLSPITNAPCAPGSPNADTASVVYTPNPNSNGSDSFTFRTNDGALNGNTGTITITVGAVNDSPVAANMTAVTAMGTPTTVVLGATDVETCELSFSVVTGPSQGTLGAITNAACTPGNPNSDADTVVYTPNAGFSGIDTFTYRVNDGASGSNTATVTVTITDSMNVGDLDGAAASQGRNNWRATVTARVENSGHVAVAGATIYGTWSGGYNGGTSCVTQDTGGCSVTTGNISRSRAGTVSFTVTNVVHPAMAYGSSGNHDPDGDSDGTTITVLKP